MYTKYSALLIRIFSAMLVMILYLRAIEEQGEYLEDQRWKGII